MVSTQSIDEQLKRLNFNQHAWGRTEVQELHNIILPEEEIYELVNGIYEGGFALLVTTNVRVLLIDKKPLNYLTVEDLRFDMINEIDYSHRLLGAKIIISAGSRDLSFRSYNQPRLRKAINHVQNCMAEAKKKQDNQAEDQKQHLERINQQLQIYLLAQHQQQERLRQQIEEAKQKGQSVSIREPEIIKPEPELADYLFAQSLLRESQLAAPATPPSAPVSLQPQLADLYREGVQEVFGKQQAQTASPLEINPLRIAYSKLPMALRNRKFGRPSFHAHSQAQPAIR